MRLRRGLAFWLALTLVSFGALSPAAAEVVGPEPPEEARELYPLPPDVTVEGSTSEQEEAAPGRYVVVLDDQVEHPGEVAREQAEERHGELGFIYRSALVGYSVSDLSPDEVRALRRDPRVRYVEPDRRIEAAAQVVPTGVSRIFAATNAALDIDEIDDVRVNADVAVIDGRVDPTHPDLNVSGRINCVPAIENGTPECVADTGTVFAWHATHVAGMIGALDNSSGVVGVAPGARIWSVRVFNDQGVGYTSWTNAAIDWVAKHASEIEVANMSLGGSGVAQSQNEAIAAATSAGVVNVVAAGNQSVNAESRHPASSPDVITVSGAADYDGKPGGLGASTCNNRGADDTLGTFSNWGGSVELAAPSVCIYSTDVGGSYSYAGYGTSFATPHVAGAAAVLAAKANPASKQDVESIRRQLIDSGSLNWRDTSEDGAPEPLLYLGGTPLTQPEVATGGWSSTDGRTAALTGAVNPRGSGSSYRFELGATTAYGESIPASPVQLAAGTNYRTVSQTVQNLEPDTTYHYRLALTTASGTVYGQDHILNTSRLLVRVPSNRPAAQTEWLNDVSCPAAGSCFATAYYYDTANHVGVYRLLGGQWSFSALPQAEGSSFPQLFGVSCSAVTACTAVGRVKSGGRMVPLAERWNGSAWALQSISPPYAGAPDSVLNDVSCSSSTECMAVGYYRNSSGTYVNYASLWKGGVWTEQPIPNTAGATQSILEDVSCVSSTFCTAVGWINTGNGSKPVVLGWNGSTWSLKTPARASGTLYGVDCVSASFCAAVGGQLTTEVWNGTKWTSQSAAKPVESSGGYLEGVSCTTSGSCTAVGAFWKGPRTFALAEGFDGTSWKTEPAPREMEKNSHLSAVGCLGLSGCAAVGGAQGGSWSSLIVEREGVTADPPGPVLPGKATLQGTVIPDGIATSYKFEFGKTTAYGSSLPTSPVNIGAGTVPVEVSQEVGELEPETVYHYRVAATNTFGTTFSKDRVFRSGTPSYHLVRSFGSSGSAKGQVDAPWGLNVDAEGNVWVADRNNNRVEKFTAGGQFLLAIGNEVDKTTHGTVCTAASGDECGIGIAGSGPGQFKEPLDLAVASSGVLWVTDGGNNRVQKLSSQGAYLGQFGSSGTGDGQFTEPWGIDIASNGDIWVADARYSRIERFNSAGSFIQKVSGFEGPRGLEIDANDHVWVTERISNQVQELSPAGTKLGKFGSAGTGPGQFDEPQAVDVKASGDLLVTDRWNDRVQQFSSAGEWVTEFGNEQVIEPRGVVDASGGVVYVSNSWKDRIDEWRQNTPVATTEAAQKISSSGATITGTIDPRGTATEYRFEYGKTSSYGVKLSTEAAGSGTGGVAVSKILGGLEPATTYHFRIVAISSEGTTYGRDGTFTTAT